MKMAVGILLIVVGVIGLAVGGINYTRREKVIDWYADVRRLLPLPFFIARASTGQARRPARRRPER